MANLSITSRCNRHCNYCFAQGSMRDPVVGGTAMGLEVYERALDFLQRSGIDEVRLLGGEPTLHPFFAGLVDAALGRAMRVSVFTGGLIPRKALEHLARIDSARLTVLVNVLHPASARASELRRQTLVFEALAERVVVGVNIAGPGVDAAFLLDLVDRHALRRCIRIGLAHPAVDGGNRPLNLRHYAHVGRQAAFVAEMARQRGVAIEWDCGWVPCMFPASAQVMLKDQFDQIGVRCNPILDILPDGRVIPCFPLGSVLDDRLSEGIDAATLRLRFARRMRPFAAVGLFRRCADCRWRAAGHCTGGCRAAALLRLCRHGSTAARHPVAIAAARPMSVDCA
jgi:radical SAM protein with 4Fe4S-binding SPASM domain